MAYPQVIDRPINTDEISIYLGSKGPISINQLTRFLNALDRTLAEMEVLAGLNVEIAEFATGSFELRFRFRKKHVKAVKRLTHDVTAMIIAGIVVSMVTGDLQAPTKTIIKNYDVGSIVIQAVPQDGSRICENVPVEKVLKAPRPVSNHNRLKDRGTIKEQHSGAATVLVPDLLDQTVAGRIVTIGHERYIETAAGNRYHLHSAPWDLPEEGSVLLHVSVTQQDGKLIIAVRGWQKLSLP